jgi:hypothetical protein
VCGAMETENEWTVTQRELDAGAWRVYWHVANPPEVARRWENFTCVQLLCATKGDAARLAVWLRDMLGSGEVDPRDEQAVAAQIQKRWSRADRALRGI